FSLKGSVRFAFLFSFVSFFILKSASALVYLGQSYSGWGIGGYGWNDVASLYATSGRWFDFAFLFALFYSAALGVFGEKFKENNAGKGIAVALGLILALSLVLYESYMGITLWELAAPLVVLLALLGTFALVHGAFKKMSFKGWTPPLAAIIATVMMWYAIMSSTGMGQRTFMDFTLGSFDLSEPLLWMLGPVFIFLLIKSLFAVAKNFKGGNDDPNSTGGTGGTGGGWPNWLKPWRLAKPVINRAKGYPDRQKEYAKKYFDKKNKNAVPVGNTPNPAIALPAGSPGWKNKQVDPVVIKQLGQAYNQVKKPLESSFKTVLMVYGLLVELRDGAKLVSSDKKLLLQIDKVLDMVNTFRINISSKELNLNSLEKMRDIFRGIHIETNKILVSVSEDRSIRYSDKINFYMNSLWDKHLKHLEDSVRFLKNISREHLGESIGNFTMVQYVEILIHWKKLAGRIPTVKGEVETEPIKEREQKRLGSGDETAPQDEPVQEEIQGPDAKLFAKKLRNEIALRTHPDRTSNLQLRNIYAWANQAYSEGDFNKLRDLKDQMYRLIGNQQKALPAPQNNSIDLLNGLLSVPISFTGTKKRGFFVRGKRNRELNVAMFASHLLFSKNKSNDSKNFREYVTQTIPSIFSQLDGVRNLIIKADYNAKNQKNYDEFMKQYDIIKKFQPKIDKIQNGVRADTLKKLTSRAFLKLSENSEFNQLYLQHNKQRSTTGSFEEISASPENLSFLLSYDRIDGGQKVLFKYFDIAYDALISLNAMLNKMGRIVNQVKKDWK
ncbi:hypothetical protein HOM13_01870, partial [Candidatus Woesearchaeota archaeon]|nr:hypothetical protein [Candidatus Woesearchaeota archaeon]